MQESGIAAHRLAHLEAYVRIALGNAGSTCTSRAEAHGPLGDGNDHEVLSPLPVDAEKRD